MKVRNPKLYRDWISMERRSDRSYHYICDVCDRCVAAEWFNDEDKLFFRYSKAGAQYNHARELLALNSVDAFDCLLDALENHLIVWNEKGALDRDYFQKSEEYCVNTMHTLVYAAQRFGLQKELLRFLETICAEKRTRRVDPIAVPLMEFVRSMPERGNKSDLDREYGRLARLGACIQTGMRLFINRALVQELQAAIAEKKRAISEAIRLQKN
jgi:hypothetical protein